MKKKFLITILLLVFTLAACGRTDEPITRTDFHMGTVITITVYGGTEETLDKAFDEIERLESLLSRTLGGSDVYKINEASGLGFTIINPETAKAIEEGIRYYNLSNGYFDITVGPLVSLWGIGTEEAAVPGQDELADALAKVNISKLSFGGESAELLESGMALDLGGIAKGYVADEVAHILKNEDCSGAVINLGGNVLTIGVKPDSSKWRIGIQDPFQNTGIYMEVVEVEEMSVVTSGPYERNFSEDGIVYHHILDPFTGYPVQNNIAGVTVISRRSTDGDALSTSIYAMGTEAGLALIESLDDTECYFILDDGSVLMSSGFEKFLVKK